MVVFSLHLFCSGFAFCSYSQFQIDIESFLSSCKDYYEYDRLAKDCVADGTEQKSNELINEEKLIRQFLNIPLFKNSMADEQYFKIGRKLCTFILERVVFNGGDTIMHICARSDNITLMERLLDILRTFKLNELINLQNYHKESCAHIASAMNKPNILDMLRQFAGNINGIDSNSNTPLHVAIQNGNDDCVSTLLHKISLESLHQKNNDGQTALHLASIKKNLNVVKMLHRKTADAQRSAIFDDIDGKHGNNALHIAIRSDAYDVAEYLIVNQCVNPLKTNKSGHTALYLARIANATRLLNLMRTYTISTGEQPMESAENYDEDDDDASSKDSFESSEANKVNFNNFESAVAIVQ